MILFWPLYQKTKQLYLLCYPLLFIDNKTLNDRFTFSNDSPELDAINLLAKNWTKSKLYFLKIFKRVTLGRIKCFQQIFRL